MLSVKFVLGSGPFGEVGVLEPIYQKYYVDVLGFEYFAVSATAIPIKKLLFTFIIYCNFKLAISGWY
jgi:hypothetical protein